MEDCLANESIVVRRFAQDEIAPKVREMDEKELMDPAIIKGLFENGVSITLCCCYHHLRWGPSTPEHGRGEDISKSKQT